MRIARRRNPLAAFLFIASAVFTCTGKIPADADEPMGKDLVGSWEIGDKVTVFSADGTGMNNDGSRFRWELKERRLIARKEAPDGKLGEEWSILISFTKDRKEFSYLLGARDGGRQRVTFHKLDRNGRRFGGRTDADRAYPPNAEALKGEGPPADSAPTPIPRTTQPTQAKLTGREAIIRVGPKIQVSKQRDGIYQGEVTLAADPPKNPGRMAQCRSFRSSGQYGARA